MPWFSYSKMPGSVANVRCHRCGNSLGFGSTLQHTLGRGTPIPQDPRRQLERLRRQFAFTPRDSQIFCRWCQEQSAGVTGLTGSRRPGSRYEDAEGRIDIPRFLADAPVVYGLKGRPLGLELRDLDWKARGIRRAIGRVSLRYAAEGTAGRQGAVLLNQGAGLPGESIKDRLLIELQAIVGIVTNHGSGKLRDEYLRRGNIHRDWTTLRLSIARRRLLTVEIDHAPVAVELSHWWEPEPVALAHLMPGGTPVLAASTGITPVELLTALKTLAALQRDPQALAEHQQDYRESGIP